MIGRALAVRYDGVTQTGRNKPLLVTVQEVDGSEYDVFLKPSGRPELSVTGLSCEAMASCLAGYLGLPICRPFLVDLDPEWIESIVDPDVRQVLAASNPVAFASEAAGKGWKAWAGEDILTQARRPNAMAIFAFDAFIENPDRKPSNPNLLVRGDEFRIIDHELALLVRMLFPRPTPWSTGYLSRLIGHDGHVFATRLKGGDLPLDPVHDAWLGISDAHLAGIQAAMPAEWAGSSDAVAAAMQHLANVRDRIGDCLNEIRRALG